MRKKYLIALFIALSLFGAITYFDLSRENRLLLNNLDHMSRKLSVSESERERLAKDISRLNSQLIKAKKTIRKLQINLALIKEEKLKIGQEVDILRREKDYLKKYLEVKSYSVKELKRAIREIKKEMNLVRKKMQERIDMVATMKGNRGYLVKDGKSTFKRRTIRVIPVSEGEDY